MTQNFSAMNAHFEQMKREMTLRGFSPQTVRHYLAHLRLLQKHFNKPAFKVTPDELKEFL